MQYPELLTTTSKVATQTDSRTLEYYQSIYTHCKQRFNIPDRIETFKKTLYQYIENCINNYLFRDYNISEVRHNLYESLVYHSCINTQDFNSQTLETYFQELNFNIIQYCEENYPVEQKFSLGFESETEKGKGKRKQKLRTTLNTPKTTAKHLQNPEPETSFKLLLLITPFLALFAQPQTPSSLLIQFSRIEDFQSPKSPIQQQEPILTSTNLIDYLAENQSEETKSEQETEDSENKEKMTSTYITKISKFTGKNSKTSPQEWLNKVSKAGDANGWNAARMLKTILYFLQETAGEWFENLEALPEHWEAFKTAFLEQFTNNNTSITLQNWFQNIKQEPSESVMTYLGKFNKLLRRIRQLETNEYYFNAQILDQFIAGLKDKLIKKLKTTSPTNSNNSSHSSHSNHNNHKDINPHNDTIKTILDHHPTTKSKIAITVESLATGKNIAESYNETNKIRVINVTLHYNNFITNHHYHQLIIHQNHNIKPTTINLLYSQCNNSIDNPFNITKINPNNQLVPQNPAQPKLTHYYTQPSYLTIPKEQDFHHTALSEARIAENTNLSDIFSFEFEANESLFLLSNAAANKQKAITAIYTEAEVKEKTICLILNNGSAGIIVTADGMKKTPVREIDNFLSCNGHSSVLSPLPATCGTFNKCSEKAPAFEFEPEEEKPIIKTFMALGSMSNWAKKTEQEHFTPHSESETSGWNIPYSKPEPRKQCLYIPLKYKDCHKKLLSIEACILPEEEYEKKWGHLIKRSGKWDRTPCLTCRKQLLNEYNWIDVTFRGGVCNQTCQYALSIAEKVKHGTLFNAAYNNALNKLHYYLHDAEIIYKLAMVLINRGTKEDVLQMKEAEYIKYTLELAGFDYEDEVEVYHQITSHTYPTKEAQAQWLEQMNIKLCEKCIMLCDEQWCPECYAFSILLPSESDKYEIKFGEPKAMEEIETTPVYFIESQPALQLKYFNNNGQEIKLEKAHEIDAGYDLRYSEKDTLVLQPNSLTKINLKIALKIPPEAMVQITLRLSLASKGINVREGIIDVGYTGDITIMLQNKTNKLFQIEHAEKIAQAIYLLLINILGLQLVNQREQLGKSERRTNGFGSTGQFTVPPTTTQQIFESNEQVCLEHNISIPNIYIPEGTKKVQVTFYNPNNYPIVLLNNLEIGVIHSNIFQQELLQTVLNFLEIIGHSLPKINPNPSSENYHVVIEKLFRINMEQLEPQQQNQLKELIAEFADIFAENNNNLGKTDLVQHQIYTGDAKPRQQQAY
ncbi:hypothetical protein G9A89_014612 [Geosiphon pyriformis]|nr:hypothetical protein G9A89_014612 [Geosiphon pyriformis]